MATTEKRFTLRPIFTRFYRALGNPTTGAGPTSSVRALVYGLPLIVGATAALIFPLDGNPSRSPSPFTPVLSVATAFIGGFLACFVLLLNLRIKLHESPDLPQSETTRMNVTSAAFTSLYLAVCSGAIVTTGLLVNFVWQYASEPWLILVRLGIGVVVALVLHVLVSTLSLVRRVGGAYATLFDQDTRQRPRLVSPPQRHHDAS